MADKFSDSHVNSSRRVHRPIPDGFIVKQVRIRSLCRRTQWYAVVTIQSDVSVPDIGVHGRAIGIDLGLEWFLTTSDNSYEERPKFLKSQYSKLKLLQRRAARKQKRSHNWEKAQLLVARLHHKVSSTRKDFHLKTAHKLCDQAQTVFAVSEAVVSLRASDLKMSIRQDWKPTPSHKCGVGRCHFKNCFRLRRSLYFRLDSAYA